MKSPPPKEFGPRVGTSLVIQRPDGMILMGLRKGSHGAGTWSFPGGHVDWAQDPIDAVSREAEEEIGLIVAARVFAFGKRGESWVSRVFEENGVHYLTHYFVGELQQWAQPRVMEPHKCERWEWFRPEALPSPLFEPIAGSSELVAALARLGDARRPMETAPRCVGPRRGGA